MRRSPTNRPATTVALALVIVFESGLAGMGGAWAQGDGTAVVDPPSRVGRMSRLLGTVSFHAAGETDWRAAGVNYPVTTGDAFWTEPSSAAEIDLGQARLAFDQSSEFDVDVLDDRSLQATQPQGAVFLRVRAMAVDDVYRIATPRGAVAILAPGAYEIVAGDADHATMVTVVEGAARIDSTNASLTLAAQQTGRIDGASNFAVSVVPAVTDPFLAARLADERPVARPALATRVAPPTVVAAMTGGDELQRVGDWADSPRYGAIWYPPVAKAWVPYREGHWGYVAPWGWTWIDSASWGFAPSHYGRWVQDGPRWGWIPVERDAPRQEHEAPVYAPALVSFISIGVGVGVAIGTGRAQEPGDARGSVGWVPLGPRETYVPPYRTSDRYVKAVNVSNVTNVTNISNVSNVTNVTTVTNLVNRGAATVVPVAAMTGSQPVAARVQTVTPQALAGARREGANVVQPTVATTGVTPSVAKALRLAAPATPAPVVPVAPGPVVVPVAAAPAATVQSPVAKRVVPAAGAAALAAAPVAAVPVAVALPILHAPAPAAPAHPQAGGTVVGAVPVAGPAGAPVTKPGEPSKPVAPVPAAPQAAGKPPIPPVPQAGAPAPAAAVLPAPLVKPNEPARPAALPALGKPPGPPVPQAGLPAPAAAVPPTPLVKPGEPGRPAALPALGKPPGPPVPQAGGPAPVAAVPPAAPVKPTGPVAQPMPALVKPALPPVPQAAAPSPAAAISSSGPVKPAEPGKPAPAAAVPLAAPVRPVEPAKPAPPPVKQPETVQPQHAPGPPPSAGPGIAKPVTPNVVKPAEPPAAPNPQVVARPPAPDARKPGAPMPDPGHAAEPPKPHGPDAKEVPAPNP